MRQRAQPFQRAVQAVLPLHDQLKVQGGRPLADQRQIKDADALDVISIQGIKAVNDVSVSTFHVKDPAFQLPIFMHFHSSTISLPLIKNSEDFLRCLSVCLLRQFGEETLDALLQLLQRTVVEDGLIAELQLLLNAHLAGQPFPDLLWLHAAVFLQT